MFSEQDCSLEVSQGHTTACQVTSLKGHDAYCHSDGASVNVTWGRMGTFFGFFAACWENWDKKMRVQAANAQNVFKECVDASVSVQQTRMVYGVFWSLWRCLRETQMQVRAPHSKHTTRTATVTVNAYTAKSQDLQHGTCRKSVSTVP